MKRFSGFWILFLAFPLISWAADQADLDWFGQVLDLLKSYGGLPWVAKISAISLVIVGSMKVSFLKPLWDKLGQGQVLLAPILALAGGILAQGSSLSLQSAFLYLSAGAGAIALHEILDWVKAIPGLGSAYVTIIGIVEKLLLAPAPAPASSSAKQ